MKPARPPSPCHARRYVVNVASASRVAITGRAARAKAALRMRKMESVEPRYGVHRWNKQRSTVCSRVATARAGYVTSRRKGRARATQE